MIKLRLLSIALALSFGPLAYAQWAGNPPDVQAKLDQQIASKEDVGELTVLANAARMRADYQTLIGTMERLVDLRPQSGDFLFGLATAYALAGKRSETYNALLKIQRLGLAYALNDSGDFKAVADTEVYRYIKDAMSKNGEKFGGGSVRVSASGPAALTESLSFDPTSKDYLLGDAALGAVYRLKPNGTMVKFIESNKANGISGVLGVLVDPARNELWVASAQLPQYARFDDALAGRSGLARFDLKTGAFKARYDVPEEAGPRLMSHLAIAKDGTLYIADGLAPNVYVVKPGSKEIEPLFSNPKLTDLRAIALSPNDQILYVADLSMGVYGVDLVKKSGINFVVPENLNLGGITGMAREADGSLLLVQGGTSPKRVMRLRLTAQGTQIDKTEPLDAAHPALQNPVGAVIVGDSLVTIANSQWTKLGMDGKLLSKQKLESTQLFASDLKFAGATPSTQDMMKEMQRATDARQKVKK